MMTNAENAAAPAAEGDDSAAPAGEPGRVVPAARPSQPPEASEPSEPVETAPAAEPERPAESPRETTTYDIPDDREPAPWHLWVVALLALVWNGYGAFEYVMVQLGNADQLPGVTQAQVAALDGAALWYMAAWAVAVWAGVLAALCLLLRRGWAGWLFALSMLAVMAISVETFLLAPDRGDMTLMQSGAALAVLVVAIFQFLYVRGVRHALR